MYVYMLIYFVWGTALSTRADDGRRKTWKSYPTWKNFWSRGTPTHFSDKTTVQIGLAECQHRSWDNWGLHSQSTIKYGWICSCFLMHQLSFNSVTCVTPPQTMLAQGWVLMSEIKAVMHTALPKVFCGFFSTTELETSVMLSYVNLTLKL